MNYNILKKFDGEKLNTKLFESFIKCVLNVYETIVYMKTKLKNKI